MRRAERYTASTAVVEGAETLTFAGLVDAVQETACLLPGAGGLAAPRRILVREPRPLAILVSVLACWSRGFVPVVVRDKTPEALVATIRAWTKPLAELGGGAAVRVAASRAGAAGETFGPREEALVICTSGTTGSPKLVALPAESVCINAGTISDALGLGPGDRVAVATPLGYLYGLMGGCMASLWSGAACHLFEPGAPLTVLQAAIRTEGLTVVQGPPTFFRLFITYADGAVFPGVRLITTGGEPLSAELAERLGQTFPNARKLFLYGMTEAGPRISHEEFERGGGCDGCVGRPYTHFQSRLEPVEGWPEDGTGRLCLRGPSMFLGYIGPDGLCSGLGPDGFHRTEDLVSLEADGRLRFRGRIDRVFKSGGRLVSPDAVEAILRLCPGVREVVCHAAPHPLLGLVLEADIVPDPETPPDPAEVAAFARRECEPHAAPRAIRLVESVAVAASGKIRRATPLPP